MRKVFSIFHFSFALAVPIFATCLAVAKSSGPQVPRSQVNPPSSDLAQTGPLTTLPASEARSVFVRLSAQLSQTSLPGCDVWACESVLNIRRQGNTADPYTLLGPWPTTVSTSADARVLRIELRSIYSGQRQSAVFWFAPNGRDILRVDVVKNTETSVNYGSIVAPVYRTENIRSLAENFSCSAASDGRAAVTRPCSGLGL